MKRFLVPVLLLLGASLTASRAEAQHFAHIGDTCLTLNWNGFESNPDSILVDTCLTLPGSSHAVFWVKGRYEIFFDSNAIPLGYGAPDSDLEVEWQAIDTAFPLIRNGFKAIYDSIGPFSLKKRDPSDTGDIGSHGFYLIFQNYVPNDSVTARLASIPGLTFHLVVHWVFTGGVHQDTTSNWRFFPNPVTSELHILYDSYVVTAELEITDMMGRVVRTYPASKEGSEIDLDLSEIAPGCYCIRYGKHLQFFVHQE